MGMEVSDEVLRSEESVMWKWLWGGFSGKS